VLFFTPAVEPVTFTLMEHEPLAAALPPLRLMFPLPAFAVRVPPHVLVAPFGVATTNPPGSVSVNAMPLSAVLTFELLIVKPNEVVPLNGMLDAPNPLLMVGGATTVTVAEAVFPTPRSSS